MVSYNIHFYITVLYIYYRNPNILPMYTPCFPWLLVIIIYTQFSCSSLFHATSCLFSTTFLIYYLHSFFLNFPLNYLSSLQLQTVSYYFSVGFFVIFCKVFTSSTLAFSLPLFYIIYLLYSGHLCFLLILYILRYIP